MHRYLQSMGASTNEKFQENIHKRCTSMGETVSKSKF